MEDPRESFNELMDTPLDFSAFVMNRLKVDTLTPELLADQTFELMKGSCRSQQYPHDQRKPLPLIPNSQGRQVIPFDHFINNDLAYLSGGVSSRKYTTSVTKTKDADYGHITWVEDLVPNTMWSQVQVSYDKESARDVYSKRRIIVITKLQIVEWHNYKHLDWITVRREDDKLYKFKEGDFNRLRIQDIKDMLLLLVQGKLKNLTFEERLAFNVSLPMFTRSIVIQRRVEDLQLAYSNPRGFIYQNKDKKNRLMRIDELYKFSDGTLSDVQTALDDRFNTTAGNPVKKILLKLNLYDHRSILTDSKATFKVKTVNEEQQLQALVDGKKIVVIEASVRRDLQLVDEEGTDCLPNATIFEELTRMGYEKLSQKLTFYKAFFSPQWKFLIHAILQCLSAKTTTWNEFSSTMDSTIICLATNHKFKFSKYIFESMVKNLDNAGKFLMYPRKDFSRRETPLFPTMVVQAQEEMGEGLAMPTDPHHTPIITQTSSSQPQRKQKSRRPKKKDTQVPQSSVPSDPTNVADKAVNEEPTSLGDQEDASKQGRKILDIDADEDITLENVHDAEMFDVNDLHGDEVVSLKF
ncbi:hypothetical protein Tco_0444711 [Tanacetum coccineum]